MQTRRLLLPRLAWSITVPAIAAAPEERATEATLRRGEAYFHLMRARLALSEGRASQVAREVQAAVERDPDRAELQGEGSLLLAMAGRRTHAETLARKALAGDPDQSAAIRVLADLAAARSFGPAADPEARLEAIRLYERLAQLEERAPDEISISGAKPIEKESMHYFFNLNDFEAMLSDWINDGSHLQPEVRNKMAECLEGGLQQWDISRDAPYSVSKFPMRPANISMSGSMRRSATWPASSTCATTGA